MADAYEASLRSNLLHLPKDIDRTAYSPVKSGTFVKILRCGDDLARCMVDQCDIDDLTTSHMDLLNDPVDLTKLGATVFSEIADLIQKDLAQMPLTETVTSYCSLMATSVSRRHPLRHGPLTPYANSSAKRSTSCKVISITSSCCVPKSAMEKIACPTRQLSA